MIKPAYQSNLFPHWLTTPVRFRDLDPLNHVNNAIFSTYYEQARIHFIREVPAFKRDLAKGFSFVLAKLQIDFVKPITFPSNLLIGSGIKEMGNTNIIGFQAIYDEQSKALMSVAQSRGIWFNLAKQKPAPVPNINKPETLYVSEELL